MAFSVRPSLEDTVVSCVCCAGMPGVRGVVYEGAEPFAMYVIEPTGRADFPSLRLGLVVGPWDDDSQPRSRIAIAFSCRPGPVVQPVDAFRPTEITELGAPLMSAELEAHPDFQKFLEVARAVISDDPRLAEMRAPAVRRLSWPQKFLQDGDAT